MTYLKLLLNTFNKGAIMGFCHVTSSRSIRGLSRNASVSSKNRYSMSLLLKQLKYHKYIVKSSSYEQQ